MSGAYTAKAATPAAVPDVPPGWNIDWPYPGPWPPGYTPVLALGLVAQATVPPTGSATDITGTLADHADHVTGEPATPIVWTAAWDDTGDALTLKLSGGEDFLASVSTDYSDVGSDYWGAEPDIVFNVSLSDVGRSFTLSAASTPFAGNDVSASAVITVANDVKSVTFTVAWSGTLGGSGAASWGQIAAGGGSASAEVWIDVLDGEETARDPYPAGSYTISYPSANSAMITGAALAAGTSVTFSIDRSIFVTSGTITCTAQFLVNGEVTASGVTVTNHSFPSTNYGESAERVWATIDVDLGTISLQSLDY